MPHRCVDRHAAGIFVASTKLTLLTRKKLAVTIIAEAGWLLPHLPGALQSPHHWSASVAVIE
jgi:hypothetical protein